MSAWKKNLTCTKSSSFSQFLTFYYCCTIYTSTYNFECINFPYHLFFVLFLGWTCGVEVAGGETWNENINCSCHGCRLRNLFFCFVFLFLLLFFFLHLTKKTGLQVHPTTDMQFTESREEEKLNRVTRGAPPLFVSATVWQVLGGKQRPVSVGWNWNAGRWMMDDGWMHGWMVGVSKYIR